MATKSEVYASLSANQKQMLTNMKKSGLSDEEVVAQAYSMYNASRPTVSATAPATKTVQAGGLDSLVKTYEQSKNADKVVPGVPYAPSTTPVTSNLPTAPTYTAPSVKVPTYEASGAPYAPATSAKTPTQALSATPSQAATKTTTTGTQATAGTQATGVRAASTATNIQPTTTKADTDAVISPTIFDKTGKNQINAEQFRTLTLDQRRELARMKQTGATDDMIRAEGTRMYNESNKPTGKATITREQVDTLTNEQKKLLSNMLKNGKTRDEALIAAQRMYEMNQKESPVVTAQEKRAEGDVKKETEAKASEATGAVQKKAEEAGISKNDLPSASTFADLLEKSAEDADRVKLGVLESLKNQQMTDANAERDALSKVAADKRDSIMGLIQKQSDELTAQLEEYKTLQEGLQTDYETRRLAQVAGTARALLRQQGKDVDTLTDSELIQLMGAQGTAAFNDISAKKAEVTQAIYSETARVKGEIMSLQEKGLIAESDAANAMVLADIDARRKINEINTSYVNSAFQIVDTATQREETRKAQRVATISQTLDSLGLTPSQKATYMTKYGPGSERDTSGMQPYQIVGVILGDEDLRKTLDENEQAALEAARAKYALEEMKARASLISASKSGAESSNFTKTMKNNAFVQLSPFAAALGLTSVDQISDEFLSDILTKSESELKKFAKDSKISEVEFVKAVDGIRKATGVGAPAVLGKTEAE